MKRSVHFRLSPFFFLTAFLIGFLGTRNFQGALVWVVAIFFSILFHELGHALTLIGFRQSVVIQFTPFGGMTVPLGPQLKLIQEFFVVLMGPIFGFGLFLVASVILNQNQIQGPVLLLFFQALRWINLVWTLINLFPVLPLDGGQLLRILLEGFFGFKGRRYACIFGGIFSLVVALFFLALTWIFPSIFFFLFAFQNFELYRSLRFLSSADENQPIKNELKNAIDLSKNHDPQALEKLEAIRKQTNHGLVHIIASQEIAGNYLENRNPQKAFEILLPLQDQLMDTGKLLLQKAAFELKEEDVVLKIAAECLVSSPSEELILNALASAARKQDVKATLGWLQTAKEYDCKNLKEFLSTVYFDLIKQNLEFIDTVKKLNLD